MYIEGIMGNMFGLCLTTSRTTLQVYVDGNINDTSDEEFQWSNEQLYVMEGAKEAFRFLQGNTTEVLMFRKLGEMETWKPCRKMHVAIYSSSDRIDSLATGKPSKLKILWLRCIILISIPFYVVIMSLCGLIQSRLWSFWWRWRVCDFLKRPMTGIRGRCYPRAAFLCAVVQWFSQQFVTISSLLFVLLHLYLDE